MTASSAAMTAGLSTGCTEAGVCCFLNVPDAQCGHQLCPVPTGSLCSCDKPTRGPRQSTSLCKTSHPVVRWHRSLLTTNVQQAGQRGHAFSGEGSIRQEREKEREAGRPATSLQLLLWEAVCGSVAAGRSWLPIGPGPLLGFTLDLSWLHAVSLWVTTRTPAWQGQGPQHRAPCWSPGPRAQPSVQDKRVELICRTVE